MPTDTHTALRDAVILRLADPHTDAMAIDDYTPLDPELTSYDHGLAELRVDGQLRAYLAGRITGRAGFRGRGEPRPSFIMVWPDGRKETTEHDYGPGWMTVRELDAGTFTGPVNPARKRQLRIFGLFPITVVEFGGDTIGYDVSWLEPDQAAELWVRLELTDSDF